MKNIYFYLNNCFIFFQKVYLTNIVFINKEIYYYICFLNKKLAFAYIYLAKLKAKYLIIIKIFNLD